MNPIKTGVCVGCRAKSYEQCNKCAYLMEGLVDQQLVDVLMGPIDLSEEVPIENSTSESQQGCLA